MHRLHSLQKKKKRHLPHFLQKKKKSDKGEGGGIVINWLRLLKFDFHGLGTCLVVRTLRGKSLMLHAFPLMDLSRLDGISFWQGPPTLYLWSEVMKIRQNHPPFSPSSSSFKSHNYPTIHLLALPNNVSVYADEEFHIIFCTSQIHTVLFMYRPHFQGGGIVMGWLLQKKKKSDKGGES